MTNIEIRSKAKKARVKLWQVAEELGISDSTFSRKLRREFSDEMRNKVLDIIEKLSKEAK